MHLEDLRPWQHDHVFGQDAKRPGETRTIVVIAITAIMMIVEISTGIIFGSMALFADGLHMASHAIALSINAFAYVYARRHAHDERYSFGTGKVNALGGFAGAVLLGIFALMMAGESIERMINPVSIAYNQAITVAIMGLIVNGASVWILGLHGHHHHHDHDDHDDHHHHEDHHDHNLRSAYLHVLADALTSFLAIFALLTAKYFGLVWMDPLMGIVGALLISKWSIGLLGSTSRILLDSQGSRKLQTEIVETIEKDPDTRVTDLHVWSVTPGGYAAIVSVVAHAPKPPTAYKAALSEHLDLVHTTIEVHRCCDEETSHRESERVS